MGFLMAVDYLEDYYKILEIERDANHTVIKAAFRRLSLIYHPDKNSEEDAQKKFIAIAAAYEVLSDDELRDDYNLNYLQPSFALFRDFVTKIMTLAEVEIYLARGASINACNAYNQTILMYASNRLTREMVDFLISKNACIDCTDVDGNTALIYASMNPVDFSFDNVDIIKNRRKNSANEPSDDKEETPATTQENSNKTSLSVIDQITEAAESILSFFKSFWGSENAKDETINSDENTKKESEPPKTPNKGKEEKFRDREKTEIIKILVESGADLNHVNNFGNSAYSYASHFMNIELLNLIYKLFGKDELLIPETPDELEHIKTTAEVMQEYALVVEPVHKFSKAVNLKKIELDMVSSDREKNLELFITNLREIRASEILLDMEAATKALAKNNIRLAADYAMRGYKKLQDNDLNNQPFIKSKIHEVAWEGEKAISEFYNSYSYKEGIDLAKYLYRVFLPIVERHEHARASYKDAFQFFIAQGLYISRNCEEAMQILPEVAPMYKKYINPDSNIIEGWIEECSSKLVYLAGELD